MADPRRVDTSAPRDQPRRVDVSPREQPRRVAVSPPREQPRRVDVSSPREQPRRVDVSSPGEQPRRVDVSPPRQQPRRVDVSSPADASGESAQRGSLSIEDRVFERTAAVAATEVDGVGPAQGSSAVQLFGRGSPRASVDRAGSHARLSATAPLRFPSNAPDVAGAVRSHVAETVARVTGATVDRVDVELADAVREGGTVRRGEPVTPAAAKVPTGPAAAAIVGILLAVVLFGAGVVAIRDALISFGWVSGSPLLPRAGRWVAGRGPSGLVLAISIGLVVVGIVLLVLGLKRRSRPTLSLDAQTPVYLSGRDVSRVAEAAAEDVDGVLDASADASRSKVTVKVEVTGRTEEIADAVTERVSRALEPVRTRRGGSGPKVTTTMREHR